MLIGKTALITGASRGIGRAIALKFVEHGAFVGINYISNDEAAEKTLQLIDEIGGKGVLLKGDVADSSDAAQIVNDLVKQKGQIDILVNNAAIYIRNKFIDIPLNTWEQVISNNLTSAFLLSKAALPHMKPNSKIIFISSQLAFKGSSHGADYASSKAGILGLMRSLALELAVKKICVNAIAPGTINTDLISNYTNDMKLERINEIPLKRLGTPEDIANCCLFLASGLSDYITGETINVNGGLYIH